MAKYEGKESEGDTYYFMNETIKKEKYVDQKEVLGKAAVIAGRGILFGVCAAAAMTVAEPFLGKHINLAETQTEDVRLVTTAPENTKETEKISKIEEVNPAEIRHATANVSSESELLDGDTLLGRYSQAYQEVLEISGSLQKALVMVEAVTQEEDLLDETMLDTGESTGVILDIHERYVYILIDGDSLPAENFYKVTFVNGKSAYAGFCQRDYGTGLAVLQVPVDKLREETLDAIGITVFDKETPAEQAQTVIAVGRFGVDYQTVLYGEITSTEGILSVADAEYQILATTICGNKESEGVLLDVSGNVIGIIAEAKDELRIEALAIADIFPMLEDLCNQRKSSFLGIVGENITWEESQTMKIPQGIYVLSVEADSPAMAAGIQKGDILQIVDGKEAYDMKQYMDVLRELEEKQTVKIKGQRRNAAGIFTEIIFEAEIEKR